MAKKPTEKEYDVKGFADAKALANVLRTKAQAKKAILQPGEDIYLMKFKSASNNADVRIAISPDGKNKLKGAAHLLSGTMPKFRMPRDKNNQEAEQKSSILEQMAQTMWLMSNHIQGVRVERDMALSGFLYDEMILTVIRTQDIVDALTKAADQEDDKWEKMRWEGRLERAKKNAALTPHLFELESPMLWNPQYGRSGVDSYYSEVQRMVSDVKAQWGVDALEAVKGKKDTDSVTERTLCDDVFKFVWLAENEGVPIYADAHGFPVLPMVAVRAEGSRLFEKETDQYDPFLKTMGESKLWDLQNRILTALNTNMSATLETQWAFTQGETNDKIEIDHSQILGTVIIPPNGRLTPLVKDVLSKDVVGAMELIRMINSESTIYDQALGAGSGQKDPYALVSLVSQAGRLPLIGVQTMMSEALASLMEITFRLMKDAGKGSKMQAQYGKDLELSASDIPDNLRFECIVDIDLPQDKLQQANTAKLFKELGVSNEWILSNYAGIENPDQEAKQAWTEAMRQTAGQRAGEKALMQIEQMMAQLEQEAAAKAQQAQAGGQVPGQQVQQVPPQMPAEPAMQEMPPGMQGGEMPMEQPTQGGPQPLQGASRMMPRQPQTPRGMPTQEDMQGRPPRMRGA